MDRSEFEKNYLCEFKLSMREIALLDRVEKYFKDTDDVGFHVSVQEAKALKIWCGDNDYSMGELNKAKLNIHTRKSQ